MTSRFTETHRFHTDCDDGSRLWVNDVLLVDNWVDQGPTERSGEIALTAGVRYDLRLEYYDRGGSALAQLLWSSRPGRNSRSRRRAHPDTAGRDAGMTAPHWKRTTAAQIDPAAAAP